MTDHLNCTGCTACAAACPHNAIDMIPDSEGFIQPVIRKEDCVGCGLCERVCPVCTGKQDKRISGGYLAYAADSALRLKSSSGGIFSCLAEKTLLAGGIVFGCTMTDDCRRAHHIAVENSSDLHKLRGSKYVQSDIQNVLSQAKSAVLAGREVLFSGTPCQVAGLRVLLGDKAYDNLITVDNICHGVPSPLVWKAYVDEKEKEYGATVIDISFRDKATGWKRYSLSMKFSNQMWYRCPVNEDPYLRGFLQDLYLRRSCYHCKFKEGKSQSDITLGDFWGVRHLNPNLENSEGVSVVLTHTSSGQKKVENLAKDCNLQPVGIDAALRSNPSYYNSAKMSVLRNVLIRRIAHKGTGKILRKYTNDSILSKFRRKIGHLLGGMNNV